mgnify:CR=1 FL=1
MVIDRKRNGVLTMGYVLCCAGLCAVYVVVVSSRHPPSPQSASVPASNASSLSQ